MARDDYNKLTQEWRATVINRLEQLDDEVRSTNAELIRKLDDTRREIVDLKLAAVKQAQLDMLEMRVRELEGFKIKAVQTILVVQIVFGIVWATLSRMIWK